MADLDEIRQALRKEWWARLREKLVWRGYRRDDPLRLSRRVRQRIDELFVENRRYPLLQDPHYYSSPQYFEDIGKADWPLTDQVLLEFTRKLFLQARRDHVPIYVHTAYRSRALQAALARAGKSNVSSGPHQRGAAVDIVHAFYHWNAPDQFWSYLNLVGHEIIRANGYPIQWGGDFKSLYDPAHWQLREWRKKPKLSERAVQDSVTGEVIQWKRSPFAKGPAKPTVGGQDYIAHLQNEGRSWKTTLHG